MLEDNGIAYYEITPSIWGISATFWAVLRAERVRVALPPRTRRRCASGSGRRRSVRAGSDRHHGPGFAGSTLPASVQAMSRPSGSRVRWKKAGLPGANSPYGTM